MADANPKAIGHERWYDRPRVKTQIEFEQELNAASQADGDLAVKDIVMILCAEEAGGGRCSRVCCLTGIRQAVRIKQIHPHAKVTVLFRNLYLGGSGDLHADELEQARRLGVTFFRYQKEQPPTIGAPPIQQATPADSRRGQVAGETVDVPDPLTGEPLRVPFDRVVLATPIEAPHLAVRLAALLHLPLDEHGFLVEPRVRLRPGRYVDDGVYVVSGVHQPVDTAEALLQVYATSSRVARFLSQTEIRIEASVAEVDASLCTGDGHCVPVCPTAAITLVRSEPSQQTQHPPARLLSLALVEPLRCIGCGNCVVACPVKAISLPGWNDAAKIGRASCRERV